MPRMLHGNYFLNVSRPQRPHQPQNASSSYSTDSVSSTHDHLHGNVVEQGTAEIGSYPVAVQERGGVINDEWYNQLATDVADFRSPILSQQRDEQLATHSTYPSYPSHSYTSTSAFMDPLHCSQQPPWTAKRLPVYNGQHIGPDRRTQYSSGSRTSQKRPECSPYKAAYANRWAEFAPTNKVAIDDLHRTHSRSSGGNDTTEVTNELILTSSGGQSGLRPMASNTQTTKGNSRNRNSVASSPNLLDDTEAKQQDATRVRQYRAGLAAFRAELNKTLPSDLRGNTKCDVYKNAISHIKSLRSTVEEKTARIEEYEMRMLEYETRIRQYKATIRNLQEMGGDNPTLTPSSLGELPGSTVTKPM